MEQTKINYEQEQKQLREQDYWKPNEGQHVIVFLSELTEPELHKFTYNGENKEIMQSTVMIETAGKKLNWSINKATSKTSLFGKLIRLASLNNNSLVGVKCTLLVEGNGLARRYSIPELLHKAQ